MCKKSKWFGIVAISLLVSGAGLFQYSLELGLESKRMKTTLSHDEYLVYSAKKEFCWDCSIMLLSLSVVSYLLRVGFGLYERREK